MKRILLLIIFVVSAFVINAQQTVMFAQYYNNTIVYNPAISGTKSYNPLVLQSRQQWMGFTGAPLSANISYHGVLNNRSGMGGYFEHDRTGFSNQTNLQLNYAYRVPLNADGVNVSFGVGAKIMYYYMDFAPEDLPPGADPAFNAKALDNTIGDASSGIYFYGNNFHLGYSVVNMLQSSFNKEVGDGFSKNIEERVYYGMAAYMFRIDRDWHLEPSVLIRTLENAKSEYNLSARVFYMDQFWTGLSARSNSSLSVAMGTRVNNMILSYSFDHYFGEISNYQNGTHELTISFHFPSMVNRSYTEFWGY